MQPHVFLANVGRREVHPSFGFINSLYTITGINATTDTCLPPNEGLTTIYILFIVDKQLHYCLLEKLDLDASASSKIMYKRPHLHPLGYCNPNGIGRLREKKTFFFYAGGTA